MLNDRPAYPSSKKTERNIMTSFGLTEVFSDTPMMYSVGLYLVDATAGNITLTLPVATGNAGNIVQVKRTDWVSSNTVTIVPDPTDGSFIDGTMTSISISPGIQCLVFVDFSNSWQRTLSDLSSSFAFGDGSDGVVAITSNTTLARDMYYLQLDVSSGAVVNTNGFRLFVADRLTLTGTNTTIMNNGGNASAGTGGTAGAGSTPGNMISSIGGGFAGGAGGTGLLGVGAAGLPTVSNPLSIGGAGGAGGSAGLEAGGAGGLNTPPSVSSGGIHCIRQVQNAITARDYSSAALIGGSSGGGGASNTLGGAGGGGGGSGGLIVICARSIKCDSAETCFLQSIGGNGAAGSGTGNAGGGGGGGGGCIIVVTRVSNVLSNCPGLTTSVAGGSGGAGLGVGAAGVAGATGNLQVVDHL
jgi:hypothetical protein